MTVVRVLPTARLFSRVQPSLRIAGWVGAALIAIAIFGRIMTFPLGHDEQIHVAAGRLMFHQPLYGALGYNHLPGLPLLLHGLLAITGSDHLLQTGRLLVVLGWIGTAAILSAIARHHTGETRVALLVLLIFTAGEALGPTGMAVTNNLLPIPFALLGFHLFVLGIEEDRRRARLLLFAGASLGFAIVLKVSYVFVVPPIAVAAMLVPAGVPIRTRLTQILLPLAIGGAIGAAPALIVLASDPPMLFTHTIRYFTGGHLTFWEASSEPKAMTVPQKLLVAQQVWLAGSGLLALIVIGTLSMIAAREDRAALRWWPIPLAAGLAAFGALGAFAPSPAFAQYYEPPVAFLVILVPLIYRQLGAEWRERIRPMLLTMTILAVLMITPRLASTLPRAVQPARWTGNILHAQGEQIRAIVEAQGGTGRVATLAPIVALEGRLPIYREFAAGPFLYRVADYMPAGQRRLYVTTSPRALPAFLDANPPAAIITGREALLDPAFAAYAATRGYSSVMIDPQTRLFLRPSRMANAPPSSEAKVL